MPQLGARSFINFRSEEYKDSYRRINAIFIQGEVESSGNYQQLAEGLPEHQDELLKLAKMKNRHMKDFQACGHHLGVTPDLKFAQQVFSPLHKNFQAAWSEGGIAACMLIQSLIIEAFAISTYTIYSPVANDFARNLTESVVRDEHTHLNLGEAWLKANFSDYKAGLEAANRQNLPLVWRMLNQVEPDAHILGMDKEAWVEDFMITYGEALANIGFSNREVMRLFDQGLTAA